MIEFGKIKVQKDLHRLNVAKERQKGTQKHMIFHRHLIRRILYVSFQLFQFTSFSECKLPHFWQRGRVCGGGGGLGVHTHSIHFYFVPGFLFREKAATDIGLSRFSSRTSSLVPVSLSACNNACCRLSVQYTCDPSIVSPVAYTSYRKESIWTDLWFHLCDLHICVILLVRFTRFSCQFDVW